MSNFPVTDAEAEKFIRNTACKELVELELDGYHMLRDNGLDVGTAIVSMLSILAISIVSLQAEIEEHKQQMACWN